MADVPREGRRLADLRATIASAAGGAQPSPGHSGPAPPPTAPARHDDDATFRTTFHDLQPRLLRYLTALVGDDAEDVAAECWYQITRDLTTFRGLARLRAGDIEAFRAWVATIARRRAIDHKRQKDKVPFSEVRLEDLDHLTAPDDTSTTAIDRITTDNVIRMIARLPPDQAEAVLLRVVIGLDAIKSARILGKRPGAVRTATHRGLRALGKHFKTETHPSNEDP
ncbi:MAG: RNA polymerase sigma factor [Mycobacterium sp.]|nr:RNA polymerase sigma factor [Mycobacterium sp.]